MTHPAIAPIFLHCMFEEINDLLVCYSDAGQPGWGATRAKYFKLHSLTGAAITCKLLGHVNFEQAQVAQNISAIHCTTRSWVKY